MGTVHTRPSRKSTHRRTGFIAVLVPSFVLGFGSILPSSVQAKPQPKASPARATAAVRSASKPSSTTDKKRSASSAAPKNTDKKAQVVKPGSGSQKQKVTARAAKRTKPVSRVTKVDRSRPSQHANAKPSRRVKLVAQSTPKPVGRLARSRVVLNDPWAQAIAEDRWDAGPNSSPKIVLPDMFGSEDEKGAEVLTAATRLLGRPYRFGARGYAFDCSGFVAEVFEKVGVELPHSARSQFSIGDRVPRDDLEPADLVFFHTYRRGPSHVGIYIGEDKFIHAASGFGVKISSLNEDYYSARYLGARRLEM